MGAGCTKVELCRLDNTVDSRLFDERKNNQICSNLKQFVHINTAIQDDDHGVFNKILARVGPLQVFLDDTRNSLSQKQQEFTYLLLNPLHKACFHHKIEFMRKFLETGVDLYRLDEKGRSPIEVLLRSWDRQYEGLGDKIKRENRTLPKEKVQALFESEYRAVKQNSMECFKLLINAYGDLSIRFGMSKVTALHISLELNIPDVAEYLITQGADTEARTRDGNTALLLATKYFNIWSILALLEKGADVNAKNNAGLTALHYTCTSIYRSKHAIDLLVKFGADVNVQSFEGHTPLHDAAIAEEYPKVHKLLFYDADPDIVTMDGRTVLFYLLNHVNGTKPTAAIAYNHALCEMKHIRIRDEFNQLPYNLNREYPGLDKRFDDITSNPRPLKQLALIEVKRRLGERRQTPWHVQQLRIPHEIRELVLNGEEYNDLLLKLGIRVRSDRLRDYSEEDISEFPRYLNLGYGLNWTSLSMD